MNLSEIVGRRKSERDKRYDTFIHEMVCEMKDWYSDRTTGRTAPNGLGDHDYEHLYLTMKQVPSATILRKSGSSSVTNNRTVLHQMGFPLKVVSEDGTETPVEPLGADYQSTRSSGTANSLRFLLDEVNRHNSLLDSQSGQSSNMASSWGTPASDVQGVEYRSRREDINTIRLAPGDRVKVDYMDPWKTHAVYAYHAEREQPLPLIRVWFGDGLRIQDPIPPRLYGSRWTGHKQNRTRLEAVADPSIKLYFLLNHTFWGYALDKMAKDPEHKSRSWAQTLKGRLKAFLKGGPDPLWNKEERERLWGTEWTHRSQRTRVKRLIEVLKTIDGLFQERYLVRPQEVWTWEKFDMFVLWNLSYLIGDEFLDGVLTDQAIEEDTRYAQVKRVRGLIKALGHTGANDERIMENFEKVPLWLASFYGVFRKEMRKQGIQRLVSVGYLDQTRGCGTPPPLVLLQSKVKFLRNVSQPQAPLSAEVKGVVKASVERLISLIPEEIFTGLATKSRITVTTAASWENTRREAGTLQTVKDMLFGADAGRRVEILDLNTGKHERFAKLGELNHGEYIFWRCLEVVLRTPLEELRYAFLTMVVEPGKGRTVTKARACLKIVLDLVSRLCAAPLGKGIRSSTSGMLRANQGWDLFRSMFTSEWEDILFKEESRLNEEYGGYTETEITYRDVFVSSTDYEEATDAMNHELGDIIGTAWMTKCGIPKLLMGIVKATCYKPRQIVFKADGPLSTIGDEFEGDLRCVTLHRGVLMGDPLTKIVLHIINAGVRTTGPGILDIGLLEEACLNPNVVHQAIQRRIRENLERRGLHTP